MHLDFGGGDASPGGACQIALASGGGSALCRVLVRLKVSLVAIERPDGRLLVERRLDAGLRVLALHPNQVAAARARFRVSGGKSDRFDAFVLCEFARTDNRRFRVLEPDSDEMKALRALTRAREDLVQARVALSNQLRAELPASGPDRSACSESSTARSRSRSGALPELLAKLRRAPEGRVGAAELAARRALVRSLVAAIKPGRPDQAARSADRDRAGRASGTARSSGRCSKIPAAS